MKKYLLFLLLLVNAGLAKAQCDFDPLVTGDLMLCPNGTGTLTTQTNTSYQWYKRDFFGSPVAAIPGATSQSLSINYFDDVLYYFSVLSSNDSCSEMSPEVLVDGWAFLSPYVITSGNFTTGPNGEAVLCDGDSLILEMGLPYDTLITWYNGGTPISGQKGQTLIVKTAGLYDVSGAPTLCPNFIQQMGVPIEVQVINCSTGLIEHNLSAITIYPNPANDFMYIDHLPQLNETLYVRLLSADGKAVLEKEFDGGTDKIKLQVNNLATGIYFCELKSGKEVKVQRVNIAR